MVSPLLVAALSMNCLNELDSRVRGQFICSGCAQCAGLKGNEFIG
jgi:hypothetical protein